MQATVAGSPNETRQYFGHSKFSTVAVLDLVTAYRQGGPSRVLR